MMNFFDEITKLFGEENAELASEFKIINISSKIIYIEGFKKLITAEQDLIVMRTKKTTISIFGENLAIKKMSKDFIVASGKILNIETRGN